MSPASFEPAFGHQSSITEFSLHLTTVREELVFDYDLSKVVGLTLIGFEMNNNIILQAICYHETNAAFTNTWLQHHRTLTIKCC